MEWTLEVIVIPVSDVERARTFYADQCGFAVDHDTRIAKGVRILQLTPPGPPARSSSARACRRHRARRR